METRLLETLLAVVRAGGFTAAADELSLSQSTVSAHLAELEKLAGTVLFERRPTGAVPTAAGRRLAERAPDILARLQHAFDAAAEVSARPAGPVRLHAAESVCAYLLVPVLRDLRARYPALQPILQPAGTRSALTAVAERRADLALVIESAVAAPHLELDDLGSLELALIAAPGHRLAGRRRITIRDLYTESVLLLEEGCSYSDDLARRLGQSRASALHGRYGSVQTVKRLVEAGLGIAVLPAVTVAEEVHDGRLLILPRPGIAHQRLWLADTSAARDTSAAVEAVRRAILKSRAGSITSTT
jgi:DNA-binding transcriptional LysR family regulator